jgi:predicted NodU family carbamoyl transferase
MLVLGINYGHDFGVWLLQDGRVLMCSSEERRVKVKDLPGVPVHCIAFVEGVDFMTVARV